MQEFIVEVSAVASVAELVEAFNSGFIHQFGGEWNGNLDAFNDYLWWPEEHPYRLILHGWRDCSAALEGERTWDGRPLLDVLEEIFAVNPQAEVIRAFPTR